MMHLLRHDRATSVQVHRVLTKWVSSEVRFPLTAPGPVVPASGRGWALAAPGPLLPARVTPTILRLGERGSAFPAGARAAEGAHGFGGQGVGSKHSPFILKRNSANSSGESARRPSSMKKSEAPGPFR